MEIEGKEGNQEKKGGMEKEKEEAGENHVIYGNN